MIGMVNKMARKPDTRYEEYGQIVLVSHHVPYDGGDRIMRRVEDMDDELHLLIGDMVAEYGEVTLYDYDWEIGDHIEVATWPR